MIRWLSLNQEYVAGGMLCWSLQRSFTTEPVTAALGISQDGVCGGTRGQELQKLKQDLEKQANLRNFLHKKNYILFQPHPGL